jgi:hypothetical protein
MKQPLAEILVAGCELMEFRPGAIRGLPHVRDIQAWAFRPQYPMRFELLAFWRRYRLTRLKSMN